MVSVELDSIILRVVKEHEDYAIELNYSQLDKGKDRLGNTLKPYSKAYAKKKGRKLPDLLLTGKFRSNFILRADKFPIEIYSPDEKTDLLVKKYGSNIFNLSQTNTLKFARYVKPFIQKAIKERCIEILRLH